jgi:hypothetical protein
MRPHELRSQVNRAQPGTPCFSYPSLEAATAGEDKGIAVVSAPSRNDAVCAAGLAVSDPLGLTPSATAVGVHGVRLLQNADRLSGACGDALLGEEPFNGALKACQPDVERLCPDLSRPAAPAREPASFRMSPS